MKIALILPEIGAGGAERVATILAGQWVARGHDVTLFTLDDGTRAPFYPLAQGITHTPLALYQRHE